MLVNLRTLWRTWKSSICLAIGGDTYCYKGNENTYLLQRLMGPLARKMVLWGCSIEPEHIDEAMIRDLKRFDLITVRESITQQALLSKGFNRVRRYPDPAFTMPEERLPLPDDWQEDRMVAINLSPLVEDYEEQPGRLLNACADLINHILTTTGLNVVLVPHVIWVNSDDRIPLGRLYDPFRSSRRVILLPGTLTAPQIKGYISRCRCFIGARAHAMIAALSTCVPTLALGYSVKTRGIVRDIFGDETGLVLPVQGLTDSSHLIGMFDQFLVREDQLRAHLRAVMPAIIQSAQDAGWEIRGLLDD